MNIRAPHDIINIPEGEQAPEGYAPLSHKEAELLKTLPPHERGDWLAGRNTTATDLAEAPEVLAARAAAKTKRRAAAKKAKAARRRARKVAR